MSEQPTEVVDAQVVEEAPPAVPELGALVPTGGTALAVTPQVQATELVERLDVIKQAADQAMTKDIDYGEIPGTNKPTLLKPGAEKLSVLFQLDVQLSNEKVWGPVDHLTVISRATAFHAPTGTRLGYGEGICTTRERKYAYRNAKPKCPTCDEETIFRSKKEGEGWFCWKKKGGCGAQFGAKDQAIVGQDIGEIDNPDLPDLWNTVVKMAEKRGRVDVVLAVTGASALFTQDIEDSAPTGNTAFQGTPVEPRPKLADERVEQIGASIFALKLTYRDIGLMLGASGADGIREDSSAGLRAALEALTSDQADALESELEKKAEQDQAKQDGGEPDAE